MDLQNFVAGWVGGTAGLLVGHPWDTIKVRQQVTNTPLLTTIVKTFMHEGPLGFYKGVMFPMLIMGPSNAIFFGCYGSNLRYLQNNYSEARIITNDPHYIRNIVTAAMYAGTVQVIATCPAEVVKVKLQSQTGHKDLWKRDYESKYSGMWDCFKTILKDEGFRGIYKGFWPMMIRDGPTSCTYLVVYETMRTWDYTNNYFEVPTVMIRAFAGGWAGIFTWLPVVPFDVIKSRIQTDNPKNPKFNGMFDCSMKLYKEFGFRVFTKGTFAICARSFPANAALFVAYDYSYHLVGRLFY